MRLTLSIGGFVEEIYASELSGLGPMSALSTILSSTIVDFQSSSINSSLTAAQDSSDATNL